MLVNRRTATLERIEEIKEEQRAADTKQPKSKPAPESLPKSEPEPTPSLESEVDQIDVEKKSMGLDDLVHVINKVDDYAKYPTMSDLERAKVKSDLVMRFLNRYVNANGAMADNERNSFVGRMRQEKVTYFGEGGVIGSWNRWFEQSPASSSSSKDSSNPSSLSFSSSSSTPLSRRNRQQPPKLRGPRARALAYDSSSAFKCECAICRYDINPKDCVTCAECKQPFHTWCIRTWFRASKNETCPNCRTKKSIELPKLTIEDIRKFVEENGGKEWLKTDDGWTWLKTDDGKAWLGSKDDGWKWLTWNGWEWLGSEDGKEWLRSEDGWEWLGSKDESRDGGWWWLRSSDGKEWLRSEDGWKWLGSRDGLVWLAWDEKSKEWLESEDGKKWLGLEDDGWVWLSLDEKSKEWLESEDGKKWLGLEDGKAWLEAERIRQKQEQSESDDDDESIVESMKQLK